MMLSRFSIFVLCQSLCEKKMWKIRECPEILTK